MRRSSTSIWRVNLRNFIVIKDKTKEEVARCGSAKNAIKYAERQREKYSVIQINWEVPMELSGFFNLDCMEGMKQIPDKYFDLGDS